MIPEALHISNGVLNGPVSIAYAVLAAVAIGVCVVNGRRDLEDRLVPMAGLVAAFIFAVQMLNFRCCRASAVTCSVARSRRSWSGRGSARCA